MNDTKNGVLCFDGCDCTDLAKKYGTPLYVVSEDEIVARFNELKEAFCDKYSNARICYAAKAFCTVAMFKICQRENVGIDVVSGGELYTAIKAGFPPERIEFNGNNKLKSEIEMAVDYGIGRIIIDSFQELSIIESVCKDKGKRMKVLYRVTPGIAADSHDYIVTGKRDSKFGIPLDEDVFYPEIERAINSPYVDFLGLHFHVGSQLFDNDAYLKSLDIVFDHVKGIKDRFGYAISELNLGGGFGAKYCDEERKPYSYFLDPMMQRVQEFCAENGMKPLALVVEPGRSIVAEAGISLYTVGSIKEIKNVRKYVALDGGMNDNIRPALYQAKYRGVVANRMDEEATDKVTVCGKCCESGDIFIKDTFVPASTCAGDLYAIFSTGAYGYSMSSIYNSNPTPAVVLVKGGQSDIIVKRQDYDDLLRNNVVPDYLK